MPGLNHGLQLLLHREKEREHIRIIETAVLQSLHIFLEKLWLKSKPGCYSVLTVTCY